MSASAAPAVPAGSGPLAALRGEGAIVWLAALVALMLGLHLHLTLTRSVHWDEFHFLTQVHQFARGELTSPLQTLHVQLFAWLAESDLAAVDQVVRGRLVMFAAMLGTCAAIIINALRFTGLAGALVCALAYLTFGFVVQHSTAFRTDPLGAFLCMSALAILTRSRLSPLAIGAAALALACAVMVTIKMVLYAPAFVAIAWLRWSDAGYSVRSAARIAAIPLIALAFAAALYLWHSSTLAAAETGAAMVGNSGAMMFGLSPNLVFAALGAMKAIPFVLLLALLTVALVKGVGMDRADRIVLTGLASPLLWLVFYNNTYPYFYAFILPPVCVALAGAMPMVAARWGLLPAALLLAGNGAVIWAGDGPSTQSQQRKIETAVNAMFPQPTAYFDFPGFLPRHHKANFFMTAWGIRNYQAEGEPHFANAMQERAVPLLLAVEQDNNPKLRAAMEGSANARVFHPQDIAALRESYRPVWGPVYLAGTRLGRGEVRDWNVRVPGRYRVEGTIEVDGKIAQDGALIDLSRGKVRLAAPASASAGLIWGDVATMPDGPPPAGPYWQGF